MGIELSEEEMKEELRERNFFTGGSLFVETILLGMTIGAKAQIAKYDRYYADMTPEGLKKQIIGVFERNLVACPYGRKREYEEWASEILSLVNASWIARIEGMEEEIARLALEWISKETRLVAMDFAHQIIDLTKGENG